jgi:hypothetical protein
MGRVMEAAIRCAAMAVVIGCVGTPAMAVGQTPRLCGFNDDCARAAADGGRVVFSTADRLMEADREERGLDVYQLVGRRLRLLTPDIRRPGVADGESQLRGLSRDGLRVLVQTTYPYSPADIESGATPHDIYLVEGRRQALITLGGETPLDSLEGASEDARRVYFNTKAALAANDTDEAHDLYEWSGAGIAMISTGPTELTTPLPPPGGLDASLGGATADGSSIYFSYGDALTYGADPQRSSLYVRRNGTTTEWIPVPGTLPGPWVPDSWIGGVAPDGSYIHVTTNVQLDPADTDLTFDVYRRSADGVFTLISGSAHDGSAAGCKPPPGPTCWASLLAVSRAGDRVFFRSDERLVAEDTDSSFDVYERRGSTITLITPNTEDQASPMRFAKAPRFEAVSDDGSQVAITTWSQLVPADTDRRPDIYVRAEGRYHLISTGPPSGKAKYDPTFADFVGEGDSVIFWTRQPLTNADNDGTGDVYERFNFVARPAAARSAAAASKRKPRRKPKRRQARGKTRLISAERIPPRISIGRSGRIRQGRAQVRISCPKREESGRCSGVVTAAGAGRGSFKLKRGRSGWITVGSARAIGAAAAVVVRARDALGNRARAGKRVRF